MTALLLKRGASIEITQGQRITRLVFEGIRGTYHLTQSCGYIDGSGEGWRALYSNYQDALNAFYYATK